MELLNKTELLNKLKDKYNDNWPPEIAEGFQKAVDIVEDAPTVEAIPIEWMKNKREELRKEYYDLFYVYTDEGRNNQVQVLNDFHAFDTVRKYWEKENEMR